MPLFYLLRCALKLERLSKALTLNCHTVNISRRWDPFRRFVFFRRCRRQYRGTTGLRPLTSAILASYSPYDVTYDVMEIPITQPPTLRGKARVGSRVRAKVRDKRTYSPLWYHNDVIIYLALGYEVLRKRIYHHTTLMSAMMS